ncbi:MAG: transposase [Candidatus Riflebacteria bacterium]|nr:transposase [Candidatus Riflebacteria bacterium]
MTRKSCGKKIRRRGIQPKIPRRRYENRKQPRGRKIGKLKNRWKVERSFAWFQRKFRRLSVRWERKWKFWKGFLLLSVCIIWINTLLG